jgi:PAS domain S-box-containing protein
MGLPLSSSVYLSEPNGAPPERGSALWRKLRSFFARPIVKTRAIVSLIALALVWSTPLLGRSTRISLWIAGYLALTSVGAFLLGDKLEHKFWRAMPELLDVTLISILIGHTRAIESPWFLLYLFPVMSIARYLGRRGSFAMAVIAILAYGTAIAFVQDLSSLWSAVLGIRALTLVGAALTAASLGRQRDEDASLLRAVERIDRGILVNPDVPQLLRSILQSAMEVTDSKIGAIAVIDDGKVSGVYADVDGDALHPEEDKAGASDLVLKHSPSFMISRTEWLRLPPRRALRAQVVRLFRNNNPNYWTGRLVLLKVDERTIGILGVFSRRVVHYTEHDVRRLASMAPLVELARNHARVFAELKTRELESKQRLQLLYDIGANLATERGLSTLFRNVVQLVSDHLRSEEAALFTPDDRGQCIVKRAVWGPDSDIRKKLERLETSYCPGENSLTLRVFDGIDLTPSSVIAPNEVHAREYQEVLPSGRTRDYLGSQLRIGSEVLGVIRVLNKKATDYTVTQPQLANDGFNADDQNLLDMIATQVAAAIRSASFIEKQRYFQDIIDKSPDPIIVLDERSNIRNFNKQAEKLWNRTEDQVRGESVIEFYSSDAEARRVGKALWEAEDHAVSDFMTEVRIGEKILPVRLSASLLIENGVRLGSIGLFKDQTEQLRKAEEEQLAALTQLARSLGHAIKNDLGAIDLRLDSIRQRTQSDSPLSKYYAAIQQLTTSIRTKLSRMLASTKFEPLPRKALMSLNDLLRDFVASTAPQAADAEIAFSSSLPDTDVFALGDSDRLREVLVNLLVNSTHAINAAREAGRSDTGRISLNVTVDSATSRVSIDWRDDGIGMSGETIRKAFAPYYTTKPTGSGLGLFNSRRTIENHGGSITARSTEGVGTIFRITLPLPEDQQRTTEATAS